MRKIIILMTAATMLSAPAIAQESRTFHDPCERGPVPRWKFINGSRAQFISFLQQTYTGMPVSTATQIADEMCDDMSLVGNSGGLTERLHMLVAKYGF